MKSERKRELQTLLVWVIVMSGIFFFHGFPDIAWFIGVAFACFIGSGILVVIWEGISKPKQSEEVSEQDQNQLNGLLALERGKKLIKERKDEEALLELDTAIENGVKGGSVCRVWTFMMKRLMILILR